MLGLSLPVLLMSLIFSIPACMHIVRTGQDSFWLWIVLGFPFVGAIAYLAVIVIPGIMRGRAVRTMKEGAREALDPHRAYREAREAAEESPTVHNRMRWAAAASELGRHDEAEQVYRDAAQGVHAEDPALQLGRARSLLELGRAPEALPLLEAIEREGEMTGPAVLAFARAYQALGRSEEADRAYQEAMNRMPGLEPIARYAAFLRSVGRAAEGRELADEIVRRAARAAAPFRREAEAWRELAMRG